MPPWGDPALPIAVVLTNDSPKPPSRPDRDRLREHVSHVAMIPLRGQATDFGRLALSSEAGVFRCRTPSRRRTRQSLASLSCRRLDYQWNIEAWVGPDFR